MREIELISCAVRILGIYLLLKALISIPQTYSTLHQLSYLEFSIQYVWIVSFSMVFLYAFFAFFFIKFPESIAKKILPQTKSNPIPINIEGHVLVQGALTILGVYILSWAIPDFIYNGLSLLVLTSYQKVDELSRSEALLKEAVTIIEITVGAYLAFGARGIYRILLELKG